MKTTHHLLQGTKEWHEFRAFHFGASEAAAMLGLSPYKTRSALLHEKSTGIIPDVTDQTQKLFDRGHATEASARIVLEAMIDDGLSPVTMSDGKLSASLDGLTFDGCIAFEHKLYQEKLFNAVLEGELPEAYQPQCQQILMVSGAEKVIFVCSDGAAEKFAQVEVFPDAAWQKRIRDGWAQFEIDLANYQHVEAAPVAVAAPINELPALLIEVSGSVVSSNLVQWQAVVKERIDGINTNLQTDNDFADAKQMVKFLDDGEKRIALVKSQAQAQAISIDEAFRALDSISATMRQKRLELDKLVKVREESIKLDIVREGQAALMAHFSDLKERVGMECLPSKAADFAAAIKGKRTIASMRDAVATTLANAKIEASAIADKIQANLKTLDELTADHSLFADIATIATKAPDDFMLLVKSRIAEQKEREEKRLESERQRIRAEEEARATAKAKAEQSAENLAPAFTAPAQAVQELPRTIPMAAHANPSAGVVRLLDRLDELARQLTERELSDLCIHAAHILGERGKVAA